MTSTDKSTYKKRAAVRNRREMRNMIASLHAQEFMLDHPTRNTPTRKNCYYCHDPNIYKDGVCAGHWDFLYKNMSNKQRMIEKAYHRDQRAQELQLKRDEARKEREKVTA